MTKNSGPSLPFLRTICCFLAFSFLSNIMTASCASESSSQPVQTTTATICACGDVIPHLEVVMDAQTPNGYDFTRLFHTDLAAEIAEADYAFCTLESAVKPDAPLCFYPQFNAPEELLRDLKTVGFDLICLASNHCADMQFTGVVDTIDACERQSLEHTGTYRTREERDTDRGILFRDINGIRFAFLNYTSITNQYKFSGREWAVRSFFADFSSLNPKKYQFDELSADIQFAKSNGADILIAVCHWGEEFKLHPVEHQRVLADYLLENGVDIVVGSHPHVPENAESRSIEEADGTQRKAFLFYSLGNFLSGMENPAGNISPLVRMSFRKDTVSGKAEIQSVEYTSLYREALPDGVNHRYRIIDLDRAIAAHNAGEIELPENLFQWFTSQRSQLLEIVGTELYAGNQT